MRFFRQLELRQTSDFEAAKRLLLALCLLVVPIFVGPPAFADSSNSPKVNKDTDPAILRKYVKAFDVLTKKKGPRASRYATKGQTLEWLKDYPAAVKAYSKAIEMEPKNGLYRLGRANCLRYQRKHVKAEKDYTKAIILGEKSPEAYTGRALSRMALKKYKFAIEDANISLGKDSRDVQALYAKGYSELGLGRFADCIESMSKAIQIKPSYAGLYSVRGDAYRNMGDLAKASRDKAMYRKYSKQI